MRTYVLVHGSWHGAWCWDYLAPELRARGHAVIAVDLPCNDPMAGCARYAEVVTQALEGVTGEIVVVGHSLGGLTIPLVAQARPVDRLVFLCACVPMPGQSWQEISTGPSADVPSPSLPSLRAQTRNDDGTRSFPSEAAVETFYHDCDPAVARWAISQLRRQGQLPRTEPSPLSTWPAVESRYILCQEDRAVNPEWSRWVAQARLQTEPIELPGSHSPFLSRPALLADALTRD